MSVGRPVSKNGDFTRARDGINSNEPINHLLCQRHKNVARSDDLVHLGDAAGSERERRDGLGAAGLIDYIRPCLMCCYQGIGTDLSVPARRRGHNNLRNAGNLRRYDIHQDRRRIDRFSSRNIDADTRQRRNLLPEEYAPLIGIEPAAAALLLMKGPDIDQSLADHVDQFRIDQLICFPDFLLRHRDILFRELNMVKLLRIGKKSFVPLFADIRDDLADSPLILGIIGGASFQQIV